MAHKTSMKCLQALLDGRNLTLKRDKVVNENRSIYPDRSKDCTAWYYYSTPIAVYDRKTHKLYLNHYGWYSMSTNVRFRNISAFFGYVALPKFWEGDIAIKVTTVLNIESGKTTYKGRVL